MFNYDVGTSVVPFTYSGAPQAPGMFTIAKQAFKRGAARVGTQALLYAGKHKLNLAIWSVLATTVLSIAGYNTVTAPNTASKLAGIEAEIDAQAAQINASIAQRTARYEQVVRTFDPGFDLAAWNATRPVGQTQTITLAFSAPVIPADAPVAKVQPVGQVVDAAHVERVLGKHPLVARFAKAQQTCPAVVANMQMSDSCMVIMNPLYRQLADEAAARALQDSKRIVAQAVQKNLVISSAKAGNSKSVERVSSPATKLLKIKQPRQHAASRPVRHAQAKFKPKVDTFTAQRPDFASQIWSILEYNRG